MGDIPIEWTGGRHHRRSRINAGVQVTDSGFLQERLDVEAPGPDHPFRYYGCPMVVTRSCNHLIAGTSP